MEPSGWSVQPAELRHLADAVDCLAQLDFEGRRFFDEVQLLSAINDQRLYVVLTMQGSDEVVAGAMVLLFDDSSYMIVGIAVHREHQGKGIGTALIDFAESKCRADHAQKLWCWSMCRYEAKPFYERLGFDEAFLMRQQFCGEDCWYFGKTIPPSS